MPNRIHIICGGGGRSYYDSHKFDTETGGHLHVGTLCEGLVLQVSEACEKEVFLAMFEDAKHVQAQRIQHKVEWAERTLVIEQFNGVALLFEYTFTEGTIGVYTKEPLDPWTLESFIGNLPVQFTVRIPTADELSDYRVCHDITQRMIQVLHWWIEAIKMEIPVEWHFIIKLSCHGPRVSKLKAWDDVVEQMWHNPGYIPDNAYWTDASLQEELCTNDGVSSSS